MSSSQFRFYRTVLSFNKIKSALSFSFHLIFAKYYLYFFLTSGNLKERHIWGLAQKFTNVSDLRSLVLTGLKLEGYTIDSTFYNNSNAIQEAAYMLIKEWSQRQKNNKRAYTKLLEALRKCSFHMMATELKNSVENPSSTSSSSSDEGECCIL